MKKFFILTISLLSCLCAFSQDFPYGKVTMDELQSTKYNNDTSAHGVVLQEYGNSSINAGNDDRTLLTFEYHVKIKIFDSRAFNYGTIDLHLLGNDKVAEEVDEISGTTSYIDDDGSVKKFDLEPDKIFKIKGKSFVNEIKFALPGLKKGCVIEYKYRLTSPYWTNFRPWYFQAGIPKKYSRYETHIPAFWTFNTIMRGPLPVTDQSITIEKDCYSSRGAYADCTHRIINMSDIPAFVSEEYMTAAKNFYSAIYFELAEYKNPYTGAVRKISNEWTDVDRELSESKLFGVQLRQTGMMKKRIAPVITGKSNDLDKAKAIYSYVNRTIKWNNHNSYYSREGIEDALDKHTGSSGDINLTLITALNAAGINTEAVLVSTRNNGVVNKFYPTIEEFDYVIAKANIDGKSYFLDASENYLSFGMLPYRCLNGDGRAVGMDKPSYWLSIEPNQKRGSTYTLDLTLQPDGKITGTMIHYANGYEAYELRRAIKKFNTIDEYIDNLDKRFSRIKIIKSEISNLDSLDNPVTETYQIELPAARNMNSGQLTFNPILFGRITTNPFKLAERTYPVDMGMPSERRFILKMHLPDQYEIVPPQQVSLMMPNQSGRFITTVDLGSNEFIFSDVINFNKSIYTPDEYPYLKELYNKIIVTEKSNLVFKKKL